MKKILLLILIMVSSISFSQKTAEVKYKLFVQPDSIEVPASKLHIGTEKWDIESNQSKKWTGEEWVYDDAIIFRDAGYGFASVDRSGQTDFAEMGLIGDFAFDISTNWYRTDRPGAVGELAFAAGTDNKASGYASVVFGYNNDADAHYSLVTGVSNVVGGGGGSLVAGIALDADGADAITVVGEANIAPEDLGDGNNQHRFIVGIGNANNGTYHPNREAGAVLRNGLEVKLSGEVEAPEATNAVIAAAPTGTALITRDFVAGAVPATATSTGSKGQIATDANYIYVCVATDTWVRAPLTTW